MWSFDKLQEKLEAISDHEANLEAVHDEKLPEAAVLVPIVVKNGVPFVLLTMRSMNLSKNPGEISFPGGKRDPGDSNLVDTALRETKEEIGLSEDRIVVLGSLLPYVFGSKIFIRPVVGKIVDFESFHPKLNPFEVSEMLTVPLENFIKQECHDCKSFTHNGIDVYLDVFESTLDEGVRVVWGFTAMICTIVASLLFDRLPEFEYQDWMFKQSKLNYQAKETYKSLIKSRL